MLRALVWARAPMQVQLDEVKPAQNLIKSTAHVSHVLKCVKSLTSFNRVNRNLMLTFNLINILCTFPRAASLCFWYLSSSWSLSPEIQIQKIQIQIQQIRIAMRRRAVLFLIPVLLQSSSGDENTSNTNTTNTNTTNTKNTNSLSYLSPSCSLPPEMNGCTVEPPPNANWKGFFFEKFLKICWFVLPTEWTKWQKNTLEVWPLLANGHGHLARIFSKLCDLTG